MKHSGIKVLLISLIILTGSLYAQESKSLLVLPFDANGIDPVYVLHTYNFQILLNLEYIMTFNDYNDKAIVFTIGIL